MATFELKMPKLGESITEATITKWLKKTGDTIELDDPVVELSTDKVDSEIPSPVEGVLKKQLFNEGDTVEVDTVIAIIEVEGEDDNDTASQEEQEEEPDTGKEKEADSKSGEKSQSPEEEKPEDESKEPKSEQREGTRFYSPLVRNIAKEENVSMEELEQIPGSGKDNRLTKEDLLAWLKDRSEKPAPAKEAKEEKEAPVSEKPSDKAASSGTSSKIPVGDKDEVVEMDRMRKLIADHMVHSRDTSVHITLFREADMTNIVRWRNKQKAVLQEREQEKLTFTPIFIEAISKALRDYPMVNVSLDGQKIIKRKNINVGMAVALPGGNLIVPVIKNAGDKSLLGLTKEVNDLASRARENKLKPDEIQGGTFTLTNFGTFGATMGTPIINQPQVGILGVGLIQKKPVVVETPEGDNIAIRHRMDLSLACDHRIVDGALGGMFLQRVAEYLENFDVKQSI